MRKARQKRLQAYELKESGLTFEQVAEKMGVSWQRAQFLVHRYHKLDKKNGR